MIRLPILAAVAAFAASPVSAEQVEVFTAEISYETRLTESAEGASELLDSIARQARSACRVDTIGSAIDRVDRVCVMDVVHQAVVEIDSAYLRAEYAESPLFIEEQVRSVRLAAQ